MWPSPPNSTRVIGLHNQPVTAVHRSCGTSRRASAKINTAEPQVAATTGTLIKTCPVSASGPVAITDQPLELGPDRAVRRLRVQRQPAELPQRLAVRVGGNGGCLLDVGIQRWVRGEVAMSQVGVRVHRQCRPGRQRQEVQNGRNAEEKCRDEPTPPAGNTKQHPGVEHAADSHQQQVGVQNALHLVRINVRTRKDEWNRTSQSVVEELPLNQVEQDIHTDREQGDGAQLESLPGPQGRLRRHSGVVIQGYDPDLSSVPPTALCRPSATGQNASAGSSPRPIAVR